MYHMRAIISLHCKPIPVMKTGFSLCGNTTQGNPVLALYWPCKGLQCCLVYFYPIFQCGLHSRAVHKVFSNKFGSKHSIVLVLYLLQNLIKQTLLQTIHVLNKIFFLLFLGLKSQGYKAHVQYLCKIHFKLSFDKKLIS